MRLIKTTFFLATLSLLGFWAFSLSSPPQLEPILQKLQEGEPQAAQSLFSKIKGELSPSLSHLYQGYISQQLNGGSSARAHFQSALEQVPPEAKALQLEIHLNRALNHYLAGEHEQMEQPLRKASGLFPDDGYGALLLGLYYYLQEDYGSASYQWQRPLAKIPVSLWLKEAVESRFSNSWLEIHLSHCLMEEGAALVGRQRLERLRGELSPSERVLFAFFTGLSYIKEAETKPLEARAPYYRLALSYWKSLPIQNPLLAPHLSQGKEEWVTLIDQMIQGHFWREVTLFSSLLHQWGATEALHQRHQQLLLELGQTLQAQSWEKLLPLSQAVGSFSQWGYTAEAAQSTLHQEALKGVEQDNLTKASACWEAKEALSHEGVPQKEADASLLLATEKKILQGIFADDATLSATVPYLDLWKRFVREPSRHFQLASQLTQEARALWSDHSQEEKALALFQLAHQLPLSQHAPQLHTQIQEQITQLHQEILQQDAVQLLPLILKAVRHFQVESVDLGDPNTLQHYLEDAIALFKQEKMGEAKLRAHWVLEMDPQSSQAHRLLGAIAYLEQDDPQLLHHFSSLNELSPLEEQMIAIAKLVTGEENTLQLQGTPLEELAMATRCRVASGWLLQDRPSFALSWLADIPDPSVEVKWIQTFAYHASQQPQKALELYLSLPEAFRLTPALQGVALLSHIALEEAEEGQKRLERWLASPPSPSSPLPPSELLRSALKQKYGSYTPSYIGGKASVLLSAPPEQSLDLFLSEGSLPPFALLEVAQLQKELGEHEAAQRNLQEILHQPTSTMLRKQAQEALGEVWSAFGKSFQAYTLYGELAETFPQEGKWKLLQAQRARDLRLWDVASSLLDQLGGSQLLSSDLAPFYLEALARTGQEEEALEQAHHWVHHQTGSNLSLVCRMAELLHLLQSEELGEKILRSLAELTSEMSPQERTQWIHLLNQKGLTQAAYKVLTQSEEALEGEKQGAMVFAQTYTQAGHRQEAKKWIQIAQKQSPYSPKLLQWYARYERDEQELLDQLQPLRERTQKERPALSLRIAYIQLLLTHANHALLYGPNQEGQLNESLLEATQLAQNLLKEEQTLPQVHCLLGQAYLMQERHEGARTALTRALELDPSYGEAHRLFALLHQKVGELSLAGESLERAVKWDSTDLQAWVLLGQYSMLRRNFLQARKSFDTVLRSQPGNVGALIWSARVYLAMKNPEDARLRLTRAIGLAPENLQALSLLCFCLNDPTLRLPHKQKKNELAEVMKKIEEIDPQVAEELKTRFARG